jgi:Kef-type K+ transport system membrane component KefB
MLLLFEWALPLREPVLIFTLVLLIIFFVPLVLKRYNIPGIIGLIIAGVLVGPNGLHVLERDDSIILFGTVGLLYIMFLAGLEIDLNDFKKSKYKSILFGLITFSIPMGLGTGLGYYILGFSLPSSVLLASMFASHTLLSYPIVSKMGIARIEPVVVTVGGTIITDTLALLVLAVIAGSAKGELNQEFWIRLGVSLLIFSAIVLFAFPRIAKWFFKNVEGEGTSQYIFVLAILFASAFLAELAGIEAIIGAFMAGLAMNRLIPHTSPLMNRIEFVGNAIFIPFFLIGVGMLVDLRVLFKGTEALIVAVSMTLIATAGKWSSAWITGKLFGYSKTERTLMFGLSNAQAAATLAAVMVGFRLGLLNENVLNGTILMILVTCLLSSYYAEKAGRVIAIRENDKLPDLTETPDRILVPISNPATIEHLMDLAILFKETKSPEPIFALSVVKDDFDARERLIVTERMLEKAIKHAASTENSVRIVTRTDLNIASGITRAIKDLGITEVIIGWNASIHAKDRIFGSVLDMLLENSNETIFVCRIINPVNTFNKVVVVMPPNAEFEPGFGRWLKSIKNLAKQIGTAIDFYATDNSLRILKDAVASVKPTVPATYQVFDDWEDFLVISRNIRNDDLLIVISARKATISHNNYLDNIPRKLAKHFTQNSFFVVYPEQRNKVEMLKSLQ